MRSHVVELCSLFGVPPGDMANCPEPNTLIDGGDRVSFGPYQFEVLFCPGHSPGHVAFYHESSGMLISGDVLFKGAIGRTDLPGGSYRTLMNSIRSLMSSLPSDTRVLPGHGPETTLGEEAQSNPFILGEVA